MDGVREVAAALSRIRDPELVHEFLLSILTPREVSEISRRWQLVRMLNRGISQRTISRKLGMSLCKITRGSRELRKRNSAFKRVIDLYEGTRRRE